MTQVLVETESNQIHTSANLRPDVALWVETQQREDDVVKRPTRGKRLAIGY